MHSASACDLLFLSITGNGSFVVYQGDPANSITLVSKKKPFKSNRHYSKAAIISIMVEVNKILLNLSICKFTWKYFL